MCVCLRKHTYNNIIGRNITLNVANHGEGGGDGEGGCYSDGMVGEGRGTALKNDGNPRRLRVDANLRRT